MCVEFHLIHFTILHYIFKCLRMILVVLCSGVYVTSIYFPVNTILSEAVKKWT